MPTKEAEAPEAQEPKLVQPAARRPKKFKRADAKQRRTTVRTAKLINATDPARPQLIFVPLEPGHNNGGDVTDSRRQLQHYYDKGFMDPWDYDGPGKIIDADGKEVNLKQIFCAVRDCYDAVDPSTDHGDKCTEHGQMWDQGLIRWAYTAKEYRD